MIRATRVLPAGAWPRTHLTTDTIFLDFDARHRRRIAMTGKRGLEFLLDLEQAAALHDGDALELEDGRMVLVRAEREPLAEVTGPDLARFAWHLGNRHTPCQVEAERLLIRRDDVLEDMLQRLGATVRHVSEAFEPEGGAYGHGQTHGHDHG